MTLPPLAEVEDLKNRTGQTYSGSELTRAGAVLADASALARDEAGQLWGAGSLTAPEVAVVLVLKAAKRAMENPDGYTSETDGDYTWRKEGAEDGVYFTDKECRTLQRLGGRGGLRTISTTRGVEPSNGWVPVEGSTTPFPWYGSDLA